MPDEEAGVTTAWAEEMGVDTDCVVVVAVVITAYGAMVDTAETTMEGTAGGLVGAGLNGPKEDWEVLVDMLRLVSAWKVEGVERAELVTVHLVFEVVVGWSPPGWYLGEASVVKYSVWSWSSQPGGGDV